MLSRDSTAFLSRLVLSGISGCILAAVARLALSLCADGVRFPLGENEWGRVGVGDSQLR